MMASSLGCGTIPSTEPSSGQGRLKTLEEFLADEKDEMSDLDKVLKRSVTQRVHSLLKLLDYEDHELGEMTREILEEGMEIYENCEEQSENVIELNNLKDWYIRLQYERCALLLYAPNRPSIKRWVPVEDDAIARLKQYDNFCKLYPGITSDPENNPHEKVDIRCYSDMLSAVQGFLKEKAMLSKKVLIAFNGHGVENGILLKNEPEPVPLDTVINDIKRLVNEAQAEMSGIQEIQEYQIVLGNCYSHCFDGPCQDGIFEIISLTSKEKPNSLFTLKRDPKTKVVVDSKQQAFNRFAVNEKNKLITENGKATSPDAPMMISTMGAAEPMDTAN